MGAGSFKWVGTLASGTRSFDPTYISTSKIYGINYVLLLDEFADFFAKNRRDFTTEKANAGALKTYFTVLDQATSLDPTDTKQYNFGDAKAEYSFIQ